MPIKNHPIGSSVLSVDFTTQLYSWGPTLVYKYMIIYIYIYIYIYTSVDLSLYSDIVSITIVM